MYSYFIGRHSLHCMAFEPNLTLHAELRAQAVNTTIYPYALSDHCFMTELRIPARDGRVQAGSATIEPANQFDSTAQSERIEARTLDSFELQDVGFIKVDVEGHELALLQGGRRTLEQSRPRLLIEAEDRYRPRAVATVVSLLGEIGYAGFFLSESGLKPVAAFDSGRQAGDGAQPVNNFIFIHHADKGVRI